jgi:class 3 adenylate cyclase
MMPEPVHRTIMAVDIAGFAREDRTDQDRVRLRAAMYDLLNEAFAGMAIAADRRAVVDVGDGAAILIDPDVPKNRLLALVPVLAKLLAEHNIGLPAPAELRLRIVVHAGEVLQDEHGYAGRDILVAFRLLNAEIVRAGLAWTESPLIVAVSDSIYRAVVDSGYAGVDPADYRPVKVTSIDGPSWAWCYVPRSSGPATGPRPPAAPSGSLPPAAARADSHYRSILLVDIENYSARPDTVKGRLRHSLRSMVLESIAAAGISPEHHDPPGDQGDGLHVLFGPNVAKNRLIHPLVSYLAARLDRHNTNVPERERLRLRVVVDAGDLRRDNDGYYGAALDEAFGLLNCDELRACLAGAAGPLVLAVSREIYEGIVRHEHDGIDPAAYETITVRPKRHDLVAWVHYPLG